MTKAIPWIVVAVLVVGLVIAITLMRQAQYDRRVAEANQRALTAEVEEWQSKAGLADSLKTVARSLFQLQQQIDSDSIARLETAIGAAVRERQLAVRARQEAEVRFQQVVESNNSLVDRLNVLSPFGRPENLYVNQLEGPPIEGEIVVTVPRDTTIPTEWEIRLAVTPFDLQYTLGCTPEGDADAVFETPPWVTATPRRGVVEPIVCQGARPTLGSGINFTLGNATVFGGLGAVLGLVLGVLAF